MSINTTILLFLIVAVALLITLCSLFGTAVVMLIWSGLGFVVMCGFMLRGIALG